MFVWKKMLTMIHLLFYGSIILLNTYIIFYIDNRFVWKHIRAEWDTSTRIFLLQEGKMDCKVTLL